MYVDGENEFSSAQSVVMSNDDAYSTNWYDLGLASRDVGNGIPLYVVVNVTTALIGATNTTLQVSLVSDSADEAADDNSTVHSVLGTFDVATTPGTAVGSQIVVPLPPYAGTDAGELLQYISLKYTTAGNITGGAVDGFITNTPQKYKSYAKGYTIS